MSSATRGRSTAAACNGAMVTAPRVARRSFQADATPGVAVGVAVAKYTDHLPLERQSG